MATITGSAGDDRLVGTAAADRLVGRGGNDELFGRGGGDLLDGGGGNDRLAGGAGADTLLGATGGDFFRGEAGALDSINGVPGVDTLSYSQVVGRGVEVCLASDESCDLRTDVVAGVEVAIGSRQSDVIDGSDVETSALIRGLEGDDVIVGSFNDDRLFGGPGDDLLVSERDGDDVVHGGLGNDQIGSESGDNLLPDYPTHASAVMTR